MIILTESAIKALNPTRISSVVVSFEQEYCLAEVPDNFDLSEEQMLDLKINYWYELTGSQINVDKFKIRKNKAGIIDEIQEQIGVSKERNIAYAIYAIASNRKSSIWQIWERSILK